MQDDDVHQIHKAFQASFSFHNIIANSYFSFIHIMLYIIVIVVHDFMTVPSTTKFPPSTVHRREILDPGHFIKRAADQDLQPLRF